MREVWLWRDERIEVHLLRGERYERVAKSTLFPRLDLEKVAELSIMTDQSGAVRAFRAWLRAASPKRHA